MKYIIRNKTYNTYLKNVIHKKLGHYTCAENEAKLFNKKELDEFLGNFKNPENIFEIIEINK